MMRNLIIGTAGHIDHGKTSLIKALTGIETDRLKEEKARGITIDLGFSFFESQSSGQIGVIDVPGHEKFLNNMLSGVVGMDMILLVVAADEGVMPQTVEHLNILELIGVKKGIIVMTKVDMVDDDMQMLVAEDIQDHINHTFLESADIVKVSSVTGKGIDSLKQKIDQVLKTIPARNEFYQARMPIDRVFTLKGIGTVVTGTVIEGSFEINDEICIYPDKIGYRIRNIQVHGQNTTKTVAGQRTAINIASAAKHELSRGQVIAKRDSLFSTKRLDVELIHLKDSHRIIKNGSRVHMFTGTAETLATVILFERAELMPGDSSYAQLRLEDPLAVKFGDKFIIRFYSPLETVGGGTILDPYPLRKKPMSKEQIFSCQQKSSSNKLTVLHAFIKEQREFVERDFLHKLFPWDMDTLTSSIGHLVKLEKVMLIEDNDKPYYIDKTNYNQLRDKLLDEIKKYHLANNLRPGINKETLYKNTQISASSGVFNKILNHMKTKGEIEQINEYVALFGFERILSGSQLKIYTSINALFSQDDGIVKKESIQELDRENALLDYMVYNKEVEVINNELVIQNNYLNTLTNKLKEYLDINNEMTAAEARDLFNTSRKKAIILLEYFDMKKITKREGDSRKLCNKILER